MDTAEIRQLRREKPGYLPTVGFGYGCFKDKPNHLLLVGECVAIWAFAETMMAVLLAALLRADTDITIAVYQTIRRATARQETIAVAAENSLDPDGRRLIQALLYHSRLVEDERNRLVHGCLGVCFEIEDGLLCVPQNLAAHIQIDHNKQYLGKAPARETDPRIADLRRESIIYRIAQIEKIRDDIRNITTIIAEYKTQLSSVRGAPPYHLDVSITAKLTSFAPIREALEVLRLREERQNQKASAPKPPLSDPL